MNPPAAPDVDLVRSLERGLKVIEVLSQAAEPIPLSEVARLCSTTRATARRLLLTLKQLGYVGVEDAGFRLRPKVMELGDAYLAGLGLPDVAHPRLAALAAEVQDTCSLTVLHGTDVVYVDRVKASRIMTVDIEVGTRFPAYATSTGRVMLTGLPSDRLEHYLQGLDPQLFTARTTTGIDDLRRAIDTARRDGYSIADQELNEGLLSIAVPVHDVTGSIAAAVNVSTPVNRTSSERLRRFILPRLLDTASDITSDLRHRMRQDTVQ